MTANIAEHLTRMAVDRPHQIAIFVPAGQDRFGRQAHTHLTYAQLEAQTHQLAAGLTAVGIGKGVRTVLMVRPSLELFLLMFALFKAGAVPVLVDPGIDRAALGSCQPRSLAADFGAGAAGSSGSQPGKRVG